MNSSLRALIVEDLEFWQDILCEGLTDAGYWVRVASSYVEALEALAQNEFDLVVIDPVLDDTNRRNRDGLRVLQYILDDRSGLCVIVVTSSDPVRIGHEVRQMSPDVPVLKKDEWDDDRFLAVVRDLLAGKER
ncbi:MAG: response regulator [Anaerolineales bacterium]|nr:MAG: response regulator [Anaerolineales bacterium]